MYDVDVYILNALNGLAASSPFVAALAIFFARYFPYVLVLLFVALAFLAMRQRKTYARALTLVPIFSALLARLVITNGIRFFYHRPRPFEALDVYQLIPESGGSFPSGHAAFFFALAAAIWFYDKRWGWVFFASTVLMCVARIVVGVHYFSDIVGGFMVGIVAAYGVRGIARSVRKENS